MADAGVKTTDLPTVPIADSVMVTRDGSTALQQASDLAVQLAASGAVADAVGALGGRASSLETRASADEAAIATNAAAISTLQGQISAQSKTFQSTAQGVGQGVAGLAGLVAGSGGTDGTYALGFSGGTMVYPPAGFFTVIGGAIDPTSIHITNPGYYSAGAPTVSFAAATGLTGASATVQMAANTPVGGYFNVLPASPTGPVTTYQNVGGIATFVWTGPSQASIDALTANLTIPQTIGRPVNPIAGSALTGGTYAFGTPVARNGTLYQVRVWGNGSSTLKVRQFSRSGNDLTAVGSDTLVPIVAGLNIVQVAKDLVAGNYLGFYMPNGAVHYAAGGGDSGGYWLASLTDSTTFTDATLNNGLQVQLGFDIREPYPTAAWATNIDAKTAIQIPVTVNNSLINPHVASPQSGAVALAAPDVGFKIPVGSTGGSSFINLSVPLFDPTFIKHKGRKVRLSAYFEVTNYVSRGYTAAIVPNTPAAASALLASAQSYDAAKNQLIWTFDFIPNWTDGDMTARLQFYAQAGSAAPAVADSTIQLVDLFWTPLEDVTPQPDLPVMVREVIRQVRVARQIPEATTYTVVTVNSDPASGANFTGNSAIQAAINSILDASPDKPYELWVTGTFVAAQVSDYTKLVDLIHTFVYAKADVHLLGMGSGANLIGGLPSDTTEDRSLYDVFRQDVSIRVENFFIKGSNIRYGTHFEGAGGTPNTKRVWKKVHVKSDRTPAPGYGGSGGETFDAEDCIFDTGGPAAIYMHDNLNFSRPMLADFKRCEFRTGADAPGRALQLQSLGSYQRSTVRLTDCVIPSGASIAFLDSWIGAAMVDHNGWNVSAPGHPPRAVETSSLRATALRIISATKSVASAVTVDPTSTAFNAIFGNSSLAQPFEGPLWFTHQYGYLRKVGGVNLAGTAIGGIDVDETNRTQGGNYQQSLGKRLGNCSSVNKTLTVNIDGTNHDVVFNKNYDGTGSTSAPTYNNAAIVAEINAALAGVGTALLTPFGQYGAFPEFAGVGVRTNNDTTAILGGMGVIFTGRATARVALSSDLRIDGIALADAAVGQRFRMITSGEMFTQYSGEWFVLREVASVDHAVGTELGISSTTPGVFDPAGPNKVLLVVASHIAAFIKI